MQQSNEFFFCIDLDLLSAARCLPHCRQNDFLSQFQVPERIRFFYGGSNLLRPFLKRGIRW